MKTEVENPDAAPARIAWYEAHIAESTRHINGRVRLWQRISFARGILFLASVTLAICGFAAVGGVQTPWFVAAGVVFIGLVGVAGFHERVESELADRRIWLRLNQESLARLERDWDRLPIVPVELGRDASVVASDLDLFGRASLFQLIGGVRLPLGVELLKQWMTTVPEVGEVAHRQRAIDELRNHDVFRDQLRYLCHRLASDEGGPDSLLAWSESPEVFDRRRVLIWLARFLAGATAITLAGLLTAWIPLTIGGPLLLGLLAVNFLATVVFAGSIHMQFNRVSPRNDEIRHYQSAFSHLVAGNESFECDRLRELHERLVEPPGDVLAATRILGRIAWMANLRRHGILFLAWLVLQFGFLWDFHVFEFLRQWKARHGTSVRRWLDALAQWEVLGALGQFARDHGDWPFAEVSVQSADQVILRGNELGHPLLDAKTSVRNDVEAGPPGSFLLVTGSNMSGKSTLLRAIGTNTVLAQLGAPVCARSLTLSPLKIETSMRIRDSLADGVSFFMAELRRLKEIVDVARDYEQRPGETLLFLLDEILQGTNSRERHIAVTRVVNHLIHHRAIGAVSTHDLELGTARELAEACRPVHFRESFETIDGRRRMTFDYRARPGIATTTNALELLELVGLDEPNRH